MAQAEVGGGASTTSLKADDGKQMVPTVSNSSDTSTTNDNSNNNNNNDDEKKSNANESKSDERRVSRQQSAPTTNVRVSFKKNRKNSKKDSIGNESKTNQNNNNNNTGNNNNSNNNNINKNQSNIGQNSNISNSSSDNKGTHSLESSDNESENDRKLDNPLKRWQSLPPNVRYDPCREFDNFAGDWVDSKGQPVVISAWGVIRYPNNPKLRFEAVHMGPNHLSVTFDRDPKKRKFVGKLNHDCNVLIWSNDTRWTKKGAKIVASEASTPSNNNNPNQASANSSGSNTPTIDETEPKIEPNKLNRQGSCIVM